MPRQQTSAAALYAQESQWETFCRLITHDDRNSYYIVSSYADGSWTDTAVKKDALAALGFNQRASFYMTHNGFTSRCRKSDQVRQLNALFFDLDCHDQSPEDTQATVHATLQLLSRAVDENQLPQPTMTINSGRGVQLFFVLDRSVPYRFEHGLVNEKGIRLFDLVQKGLADILERLVVSIPGIDVDRATFDVSRVSRIPGTFNNKAGRFATLDQHANAFYSLSDLYAFVLQQRGRELHAQALRRNSSRSGNVMHYQPLLMSRLNKIIELQKYRNFDCSGTRELMSFVFYNTAVQIYQREDAKERLAAFNARFANPLADCELKGIVSSVDEVVNVRGEKGYYLIGAKRLVELLALTTKELTALNFFESKRSIERSEQKRLTAQRRLERNNAIVEFRQQGHTQAQIAQLVGCSLRTVAYVLKREGQTTTRNKQVTHNIIPIIRYNKKQRSLCNFLSYESMECSFSLHEGFSSNLSTSSTYSYGLFSGRCFRLSDYAMTKTPFTLISVSFQGALVSWMLSVVFVLRQSFGRYRFGHLLE